MDRWTNTGIIMRSAFFFTQWVFILNRLLDDSEEFLSETFKTKISVVRTARVCRQFSQQRRILHQPLDGAGKTNRVAWLDKQRVLVRNEVLSNHAYLGAENGFS